MTTLKPFQIDGCRQIYEFGGRALLADAMGLGKTIQALYWIKRIPSYRPVVIVTPSTVKYTWQSEAAIHFGMRTEVIDGMRPKYVNTLPGEIVVINYDLLTSWLPALLRHRPQVVVFDECQYLMNSETQRSKASKRLVEYAESVLGLSGTPITSRPYQFWPILNIIWPKLFPDKSEFAWRFCGPKWSRWGWKFNGATNTLELNELLLETGYIRRLKKDVLPQLPPVRRQLVPFRLSKSAMKEYFAAEDSFIDWLRQKSPGKAKRAEKSPTLTKIGYLIRLVAELKLKSVINWIAEFLEVHPGKKLVCLTMHTMVIEELARSFPYRHVVINGSVTGKKRHESVRLFQTNKRIDLLFGNWKAAGIGITATAAHNLASLDFPWTPGDLAQGEKRVDRIGQTEDVTIHYLVAIGTIEESLMSLLRRKGKILDEILDGHTGAIELNILEDLIKEIKRR